MALRLQCILAFTSIAFYINSLFLFYLVVIYFLNKKRRFWITIILILLTYISALSLNSVLSLLLIMILLIWPWINNSYKTGKVLTSIIAVMVTAIILSCVDYWGKGEEFYSNFNKFINTLNLFNEHYCSIFGYNFVNFVKENLFSQYVFEFQILKIVLDFVIKIRI